MNLKQKIVGAGLGLMACLQAFALPQVGSWESHFSYSKTTQVVVAASKTFAVADGHLFSVDRATGAKETYSKIDGLSGNVISKMAYDAQTRCLLLVYNDAKMDIVDADGTLYAMEDLYRKQWSVEKTVNQIVFYNRRAYLSCAFGILVLDMDKKEVLDTYIVGDEGKYSPVYSVCTDGTFLYALMNNTIKKARLDDSNLLDYSHWSEKIAFPDEGTFVSMVAGDNTLFLAKKNAGLYRYQIAAQQWDCLQFNVLGKEVSLHRAQDRVLLSKADTLVAYSLAGELLDSIAMQNSDADYTQGTYWLAAQVAGLIAYRADADFTVYLLDGPLSQTCQKMEYDAASQRIIVAAGSGWLDRGRYPGMVMMYDGYKWTNYDGKNSEACSLAPDSAFMDVVSVAVDPVDPTHLFASTFGEGVYEFRDGKAVQLYNRKSTNEVIMDIRDYGPHYVRVDGLNYDNNGLLWVANLETQITLKYMTPDGVWHNTAYMPMLTNMPGIQRIRFHGKSQVWVQSVRDAAGVFVWDYAGTLENSSDDKMRMFKSFADQDGGETTPQYVYDICEDRKGEMWVATSEGPFVMGSLSRVFNSDYQSTRVKIPRNDGSGLADYLLDGVKVRAIAVDGANRKWLGTDNAGLLLVSEDGQETLQHFTTDNSPFSSDQILDIAIHEKTGEVFVATNDGIFSYRSDASEPENKMTKQTVKVFPNPVRPDYAGMITISGLEENTVVKITDANGQLVYKGQSNGGSLAWNGRTYQNRPLSTGVYFVHLLGSNEEDVHNVAAKFLVVR